MHEAVRGLAAPVVNGLLERIEDEVGRQGRRDAPADDPTGEDVDDQRDIDEATPGGDIREVRHPELIRSRRGEVPIDQIERPIRLGSGVGRRGPGAPADGAGQAHLPHQPPDTTARRAQALAAHLLTHFARAIDAVVFFVDPTNDRAQHRIALGAC